MARLVRVSPVGVPQSIVQRGNNSLKLQISLNLPCLIQSFFSYNDPLLFHVFSK